MEKNEEHGGVVRALGTDGEGILNCEGTTVFVPYCLEGEEVLFNVLKVRGNIAYGKLSEVHSVSKDREAPECPVFEKCGGCQLQHMTYSKQLSFKKDIVQKTIKKISGMDLDVENGVPAEKRYRYRNKLVLPVGRNAAGTNLVGFYAPRSHRIISISDCPIQEEWIRDIIAALRRWMSDASVEGYDESVQRGIVRHLVVREIQGKFVITLVCTKLINIEGFAQELDKVFDMYTLLLNVNKQDTNVIFSNEWHICRGKGFFTAEEDGIVYKAGAESFLQINDEIRKKLYDYVLDEAADKNAVAIDLYSGAGMLTAQLCKKCQKAVGIEMNEEAHMCAEELKMLNGLDEKMENICGKVEDKIGEVMSSTEGKKRVVICDPPRKGMERSVIHALLESFPEKIILISCSPATLARDMGLLCGALKEGETGLYKDENANTREYYEVESVTPFDMFPQTKHVETVCVLTKPKAK